MLKQSWSDAEMLAGWLHKIDIKYNIETQNITHT